MSILKLDLRDTICAQFFSKTLYKNKIICCLKSKNVQIMENQGRSKSSQILMKSILKPDQLQVQNLYQKCGVNIDPKTFLNLWKLCELGIPAREITSFLHDIASAQKESRK